MHGVIVGLLPFPLFFYGLAALLPLAHPALAYIAGLGSLLLAHFLLVMALLDCAVAGSSKDFGLHPRFACA